MVWVVRERTEWHNVVVRRLVSFIGKWVKKGSGLYVEGKIRTRSLHDDQAGVKRYVTEIPADRVEFYSTGSRHRDNTAGTGIAEDSRRPLHNRQADISSRQVSSNTYPDSRTLLLIPTVRTIFRSDIV